MTSALDVLRCAKLLYDQSGAEVSKAADTLPGRKRLSVMKVVTKAEIEVRVIEAFAAKGVRVSNVDIHRVDRSGAWRIGEGVRAAGVPYESLADEIALDLNKTYQLAEI